MLRSIWPKSFHLASRIVIDCDLSLQVSYSFLFVMMVGYLIPRIFLSCLRWNASSCSSWCFVRPQVPQL